MNDRARAAAIEGWYTLDADNPRLLGSRCKCCGTYFFPSERRFCRNPDCEGTSFEEVALSRTGRVWSYTDAQYQPPEPYVSPQPFEPFAIVAVELDEQKMIVLGQAARGVAVDELRIGMRVQLVLEPLYRDDKCEKLIWKWQPLGPLAPNASESAR